MIRFVYDTNCLLAAMAANNDRNQATLSDLDNRRRGAQEQMVVVACALEAYSVLTRLPAPFRLPPGAAWQLLEARIEGLRRCSLTAAESWHTLKALAAQGVAGCQIWDGLIAATARKGKADVLVTWNLHHFARFASAGLEIVNPVGERAS